MENSAIKLLKSLLEIPSVNSADNERNIAEYIAGYFNRHHIEASVQQIDETHANVVAFVPGKNSEKTVVWNGHLDTVPYGSLEKWETNPSSAVEIDGKIYARGASDMKSGLAAMIYALCHGDEKPACNIQFLGTCDEERSGLGAEKILEEGLMADTDFILIGEPTGMSLGVAQKGCLWLEIQVKGKTSHGAYPEEGTNAIRHGMRIADGIKACVERYSHSLLGASTAQVTMIQGGVVPNMTADSCCIVMDIRMVPGLTAAMVIAHGEYLVRKEREIDNAIFASFEVMNGRRAIEIEKGHEMVEGIRGLLKGMGYEGADTGINFFTDASVLDKVGHKNILLFGPGDPTLAHKANEYVSIEKYEDAIRILQKFMTDCEFWKKVVDK